MKICTKCGIEKPLSEFHKWGVKIGGHRPQCEACRKIERREKFQPLSRGKKEYLHLHTMRLLEIPETKVCVKCFKIKSLEDFSFNKTYRKKVFSRCKVCERVRAIARYSSEKNRFNHLNNKYGLSPEKYEALLDSQNGFCAICGSPEGYEGVGLYIDHDHSTGEVHGLLCVNCNSGLGMLGDNLEGVEAAAAYLRENNNG